MSDLAVPRSVEYAPTVASGLLIPEQPETATGEHFFGSKKLAIALKGKGKGTELAQGTHK
jgi:hypothetical protein